MRFVLAIDKNNRLAFVDRAWAEEDPAWRQIIPYVAIRDDQGNFALFQRKNGSEKRLQDLFTVGVGGHIDAADTPERHAGNKSDREQFEKEIILAAVMRECIEELGWMPDPPFQLIPAHTIASDDVAVDSVHLGLCYVMEWNFPEDGLGYIFTRPQGHPYPETPDEQMRYMMRDNPNPEMEFVGFKSLEEIRNYNLESWSRKLVTALLEK